MSFYLLVVKCMLTCVFYFIHFSDIFRDLHKTASIYDFFLFLFLLLFLYLPLLIPTGLKDRMSLDKCVLFLFSNIYVTSFLFASILFSAKCKLIFFALFFIIRFTLYKAEEPPKLNDYCVVLYDRMDRQEVIL